MPMSRDLSPWTSALSFRIMLSFGSTYLGIFSQTIKDEERKEMTYLRGFVFRRKVLVRRQRDFAVAQFPHFTSSHQLLPWKMIRKDLQMEVLHRNVSSFCIISQRYAPRSIGKHTPCSDHCPYVSDSAGLGLVVFKDALDLRESVKYQT